MVEDDLFITHSKHHTTSVHLCCSWLFLALHNSEFQLGFIHLCHCVFNVVEYWGCSETRYSAIKTEQSRCCFFSMAHTLSKMNLKARFLAARKRGLLISGVCWGGCMCQLVWMTKSHWAFTLRPCAGEPVGLFSFFKFSLLEGLSANQTTDRWSFRQGERRRCASEDIKWATWSSFTRAIL